VSASSRSEIEQASEKTLGELVWGRPSEVASGGYSSRDVKRFLDLLGARLLVTGHTTLSSLPSRWINFGVGFHGDNQVILATSYGSEGGARSYLDLDPGRICSTVRDLRPGMEIRLLEPEASGR